MKEINKKQMIILMKKEHIDSSGQTNFPTMNNSGLALLMFQKTNAFPVILIEDFDLRLLFAAIFGKSKKANECILQMQ